MLWDAPKLKSAIEPSVLHERPQRECPRDSAGEEPTTFSCGEVHLQSTITDTAPTKIVENLHRARRVALHRRPSCPAHDASRWTESSRRHSCIVRWLLRLLRVIVGIFYTLIPPWPSLILKKIVFRAPPRGFYYFLVGGPENAPQAFHRAGDAVHMENLRLCIPQLARKNVKAPDVYFHLARSKVLVIEFEPQKFICALELYSLDTEKLERELWNLCGPISDGDWPAWRRCKSPNLIIFSQPNSSDLGCMLMMEPNCVLFEKKIQENALISGYGVSDGKVGEQSIYKAIEAVFRHAVGVMKYEPKDIILIGLGTAAITHIASEVEVGAMVLIAPFTSFLRIVTRCPRAHSRYFDMFPSYDKATTVKCPALICHGKSGKYIIPSVVAFCDDEILVGNPALDCNTDTANILYGGQDFDSRIMKFVIDEFKKSSNYDIYKKPKLLKRLRIECRKAKESLSFMKNSVNIHILVGGSTRIPEVQQKMADKFGKDKLKFDINPDEAVAYGAAIVANAIEV
ncbi:hypothetical protein WR25_08589 [Diploscapter pachys]|uniref:Uncharacterized protein n=1 Tax=Diploscapter pachys TaxID=2018661 RepID=A0A2A2JL42_9BILA|nr:hypothetical protein WR25_08589 [Diploscapter pachys]